GIATFAVETSRLDDVTRTIRDLGTAVGEAAAGAALAAQVDRRMSRVQSMVAGRPARRVLFLVWLQPVISAGRGGVLSDFIGGAGAQSIADATGQPWPHLSIEEILRQDPEYILVPKSADFSPTREEFMRMPGWKDLAAVRSDKIIYLPEAVQRPGPRIAEMM